MNSKFPNTNALLYCCAILLAVTASAFGQAGQLDSTFGNGGIASQQAVIAIPLTPILSVVWPFKAMARS